MKKRIGILTRHAVANYGSLLQAHALEQVLIGLGYDAYTINYVNHGEQGGNLAYTLSGTSRWRGKGMKRLMYLLYQYPSSSYTYWKFKGYRQQYLRQGGLYSTREELKQRPPAAEIYCTGSDQVWNTISDERLDASYFLQFGPTQIPHIAYGASFDSGELSKFCGEDLREWLNGYAAITVREVENVAFLTEMGIDSASVIDPTLLLSPDYWSGLAKMPNEGRPYILVYQLNRNPLFDEWIRNATKAWGIGAVRVSTFFYQIMQPGRFRYIPTPEEVLGYIKGAACVITDSFHATALSMLLHTEFIEILPSRYPSRIVNLLELTGLQDRVITGNDEIKKKRINYARVDAELERERKKSLGILADMCRLA